jgi:hypothetical protein
LSLKCAGVLCFCLKNFKKPSGPAEGSQLIVYSLQLHRVKIHINY